MVGTPANSVTPSRSRISNASAGLKRGSSVKVPPFAMVAFWMTVCPNEWKSGSVAKAMCSSGGIGISFGTTTAQFTNRFACVSSAPFGFPVVPDV